MPSLFYRISVIKHISSYIFFAIGFFFISFSFPADAALGGEKLTTGAQIPELILNPSGNPESINYLGLKNKKPFSVSRLPAKFILIEIFSLYCPVCHKQAPAVNRIHKIIQQDPALSKDIKMIGIGAGNTLKEIDVYKNKLHVMFPLFADHDFRIHKQLGEPRTPFLILVSSKGRVLLTHSGDIKDFDEFFSMLKKACGHL